jgi:DNA (cytosine-5)-methyltransferase 1
MSARTHSFRESRTTRISRRFARIPSLREHRLARAARQYALDLGDRPLIVDEFACGGGMSRAIELAFGRHVDVSVNHDNDACSMHQMNHPETRHFCADVFGRDVAPTVIDPERDVDLLHLSPDCTDHSQAKGGQPRSKKLRALPWIGVRWAAQRRPKLISCENVVQIQKWGRLIAKRCKLTGRVVKLDGTVAEKGERVPVQQQYLIPDPKHAGKTWGRFVGALRSLGYEVDWWALNAADFGVPTTRVRLFMIARCDGVPIVKPEPTHFKAPKAGQRGWRGAHECIDWSIEGRSIFGRERPLVQKTLRRVAKGARKFVLDATDPFIMTHDGERISTSAIVPVTHSDNRVHNIREPLPTVTTAKGGEFTLMTAWLMQANGGFNDTRGTPGHDLRRPFSTVTNKGAQQQLVAAHLVHLHNNCDARDVTEPLRTVSAGGEHHGLVRYHLSEVAEEGALRCAEFLREYGEEAANEGAPMTREQLLELVTVWVGGKAYVIVDITLRMLEPRELFRAQGFEDDYVIDRGHDGREFPKWKQVWFAGNSVPPPLGRAVIEAQLNSRAPMRKAA